jgi:hypothetical protein
LVDPVTGANAFSNQLLDLVDVGQEPGRFLSFAVPARFRRLISFLDRFFDLTGFKSARPGAALQLRNCFFGA